VETVFMHILRGTALEGLAGMPVRLLPNPWSASIPLVRPLLSVWRNDIEAYCLENGLEPVQDNSNQDISYTRNRIRKQLLPVLERYNPRFKHALWRMSQILEADIDLLQQATHAAWKDCLAQTGDGFVTLHQDRFCSLPLAIQRRLLRQTFASLERVDLDYEMVERGIQSVNQPRLKSRIDLGRGLSLFQEDALIWLAAWEAELPAGDWPQVELAQGETLSLNVPGNISLSPGWNLSSEWLPGDFALPMAQCNTDPFQAFIDANLVNLNLVVRPRIPGDQFHPLGLEAHTQKLSDFMINVKLPRRSRQKWPLVCMGDRVIWIPGYALSHFARLEAGTAKAIHLRVKKAN
jgi:tRNA(Ile)-lysidine synthase